MQAVILAGGVGSRLGNHTKDKPKCLVEVGGKPLIRHQLDALSDHGVGKVLVVLGYCEGQVREVVGDGVDYVVNTRYRETNSLYSLALAKEWVKGPFILLNCDLLFHPDILDRLLAQEGSALAYDSTSSGGREQTKVAIREGLVLDLGKDMPAKAARGESLGLLKFDSSGAIALFESVDEMMKQHQENAWGIEAIRTTCSSVAVAGVNVAGLPWVEVDFPIDLDRARREVWPAISGEESRIKTLWKRARWAAVAAVVVGVAAMGWMTSSSVGPASIDWESVRPAGAKKVSLQRAKGPQKWWLAKKGQVVSANVESAARVRIEFRALYGPDDAPPGHFVVEIDLDGEPYDWRVFNCTPDTTVTLPGYRVGDRDRLVFDLDAGVHTVGVKLLAGRTDCMITRIRRPE